MQTNVYIATNALFNLLFIRNLTYTEKIQRLQELNFFIYVKLYINLLQSSLEEIKNYLKQINFFRKTMLLL